MYFNRLLTRLFGLLILLFVFESCSPPERGTCKNDKIESGRRDDFHKRNEQMLAALKANNPLEMEAFMSKGMIEDNGRLRLIELCSNRLKEGAYSLSGEYYIVNETRGQKTLDIKDKGINKRTLSLNSQ